MYIETTNVLIIGDVRCGKKSLIQKLMAMLQTVYHPKALYPVSVDDFSVNLSIHTISGKINLVL